MAAEGDAPEARGPFRLLRWQRGAGGGEASGDRAWVELPRDGVLRALLADAAGHGAQGEAFWGAQGAGIGRAWEEHLRAPPGPVALRALGERVGRQLFAAAQAAPGASPPYLACLALDWRPDGALDLVTWGWGVHALVETDRGPWWPPLEERVGLKLGWLEPAGWGRAPRACPLAAVAGARRVLLLSDGFLGDDHRDPLATWATLRAIGAATAARDPRAALAWLLEAHPPDEDDATVCVIELSR